MGIEEALDVGANAVANAAKAGVDTVKQDVAQAVAAAKGFVEDNAAAILKDLGAIAVRVDRIAFPTPTTPGKPSAPVNLFNAKQAVEQAIISLAKHIGG